MTESNGHPPGFTVELTGLARAQLRAIGRHAKYAGTAGEIAEVFGRVLHRLRRNPRGFGEPMYRLKMLRGWTCSTEPCARSMWSTACTTRNRSS